MINSITQNSNFPQSPELKDNNPLPAKSISPPTETIAKMNLQTGKPASLLNKVLFISGPLIMIICFGFSFFLLSSKNKTVVSNVAPKVEKTSQQYELTEVRPGIRIPKETREKWDIWLNNIPKNPDKVIAKTDTSKELESRKPYSYPNPVFTWSGEQPSEPNTKIIGYYVYFGEKNNTTIIFEPGFKETVDPQKIGKFQSINTYKAENLEKGKSYYLFVQAVSDSQNPNYRVGYAIIDKNTYQTRPADVLFEYYYE